MEYATFLVCLNYVKFDSKKTLYEIKSIQKYSATCGNKRLVNLINNGEILYIVNTINNLIIGQIKDVWPILICTVSLIFKNFLV